MPMVPAACSQWAAAGRRGTTAAESGLPAVCDTADNDAAKKAAGEMVRKGSRRRDALLRSPGVAFSGHGGH